MAKSSANRTVNQRCWYSKLSVEQLQALAAACGFYGCDLVTRLHAHPLSAPYGVSYKAQSDADFFAGDDGSEGLSLDSLKYLCAERSLPVSGSRFTLVLALLNHDGAPARAAMAAARHARDSKSKSKAKAKSGKLAKDALAASNANANDTATPPATINKRKRTAY